MLRREPYIGRTIWNNRNDDAVAQLNKGLAADEEQGQASVLSKSEAQLRLELVRLAEAIAKSSGSLTLLGKVLCS